MLWNDILSKEDRALAKSLATRAQHRREECTVYPSQENIFRALTLTSPDKVKAVIIGQDPYINPGQAEGLCFSVAEPTPPPPSLQNVFKELVDDLGVPMPTTGSLVKWAEEGVLLLNTTLSVDAGHSDMSWRPQPSFPNRLSLLRGAPMPNELPNVSLSERTRH